MNERLTSRRAGGALVAVGLCFASLVPACGSRDRDRGRDAPAGAVPVDESRVILRVGPDSYSLGDFSRYIKEAVGTEDPELNVASLSRLYDRFIEEKILLRAASDKGITILPEDKQAYLEEAEEDFLTDGEKADFLAADSGPLIDRLKIEKYSREITRNISVGDEEIGEYYDRNPGEFSLGERAQVSQVLLSTEAEAVEVWERARFADESGFRALAQSESIGPEASEGGVMGIFQKGQLPAELEGAVFGMGEGEVSPIVETSYGFHIFRLDKRFEPEQTSFEDAVPAIRQKILGLKAEAMIKRNLGDLMESLDWRAFPENLSFPYQRM